MLFEPVNLKHCFKPLTLKTTLKLKEVERILFLFFFFLKMSLHIKIKRVIEWRRISSTWGQIQQGTNYIRDNLKTYE